MAISEPTYSCPVVPAVEMKVGCFYWVFVYDISFDNSSVQKLQTIEQITWKHEWPCILHLLEVYKSLFSITTTPCCNLCISSLLAFKSRVGWLIFVCFFFPVTLCFQSPVAPGFWSLLEFLSPAKRTTELAMVLDHHSWSNGTLLRKDYSLSSSCYCCPAYAQTDTMTWKKPLGWNKNLKKEKQSISPQSCWLNSPLWESMVSCGWACRRHLQTILAVPALPGHSHALHGMSR